MSRPTIAALFGLAAALGGASLVGGAAQSQDAADPLPRRAFFGVALAEAEDGVAVTSVVEGSTAAAMGVAPGDVLQAVDGVAMTGPADVIAAFASRRAGDVATVTLARDGAPLEVEAALRPTPIERMANATMTYGSVVTADGVRLRTILSMPEPAGDGAPAVMLIQGGGCGSVDTPIGPLFGQAALLHALGSQGFATYRVEKSGVGDSEGPPCSEIGYFEELDGYRAGLAALRAHPAVDRERVFLLGVSLGGVFAPILANETTVAGIVTYGTINFAPNGYPGRSERFFEEFQANVDVLAEWARVESPVLLLRGEFDEGVEAAWSASIAATVNQAHPGRAEHRDLPGLDHCWTRHPSMEASAGRCGQGEATSDLSDAVLAFLRERA